MIHYLCKNNVLKESINKFIFKDKLIYRFFYKISFFKVIFTDKLIYRFF